MKLRLQKFLAQAGISSRRKAEELIAAGRVKVNGEVATVGESLDPTIDRVQLDNKPVTRHTHLVYFALNKPVGYVSSASSSPGKSVLQLVKSPVRLFPVGRLDKDSSGLLLLTNDGAFTERVTHARYGCEKEYFVVLDRDLTPGDTTKLGRGFRVGPQFLPGVKIVMAKNKSARFVLKQGLNRQIRRMLGRLGYNVNKLKRIRIGRLQLADLAEGKTKPIQPTDVLPDYAG